MSLKTVLKQWEHSPYVVVRAAFHVSRRVWWGCQLLTDARFRSERLGQWRHPDDYHQVSTATSANRNPWLFDDCRQYLDDGPQRRLLSFGCSTGEEVLSLAARWPQATIVGVDLNAWCIAQCRRRHRSPRHTFLHRLSPDFTRADAFDAIFCLAVFQRPDNRTVDNPVAVAYTFEQFEREIVGLDAKLKPGGLLAIDNADFRFTDTVCAGRYTPLDSPNSRLFRRRPLYDRSNRRLANEHSACRIYVKGDQTTA